MLWFVPWNYIMRLFSFWFARFLLHALICTVSFVWVLVRTILIPVDRVSTCNKRLRAWLFEHGIFLFIPFTLNSWHNFSTELVCLSVLEYSHSKNLQNNKWLVHYVSEQKYRIYGGPLHFAAYDINVRNVGVSELIFFDCFIFLLEKLFYWLLFIPNW